MTAGVGCRRLLMLSLCNIPKKKFKASIVVPVNALTCVVYDPSRAFCSVVPYDYFNGIKEKNKESFLLAIRYFYEKENVRSNQVDFINRAMKYMDEFGVSDQREVYMQLLDLFPKGKLVPENQFQVAFKHYPWQQDCAVELLDKMEENGVAPNKEMYQLLVNIFGKYGYPVRKVMRMLYWMPKFKNLSPWLLPKTLPNSSMELAKLAITRICSVDPESEVTVYDTSKLGEEVGKTWIVSGQSVSQRKLIEQLPKQEPAFIEGPFRIWLGKVSLAYFVLRASPSVHEEIIEDTDDVRSLKHPFYSKSQDFKPLAINKTVHEQEDGIYLAVCASGTSDYNSLIAWMKFLEQENSGLCDIPIMLNLKSSTKNSEVIVKQSTQSSKLDVDYDKVLQLRYRDSRLVNEMNETPLQQ